MNRLKWSRQTWNNERFERYLLLDIYTTLQGLAIGGRILDEHTFRYAAHLLFYKVVKR